MRKITKDLTSCLKDLEEIAGELFDSGTLLERDIAESIDKVHRKLFHVTEDVEELTNAVDTILRIMEENIDRQPGSR